MIINTESPTIFKIIEGTKAKACSAGAYAIAEERLRQIADEGITAEHDAVHDQAEMTAAANAYIELAALQVTGGCGQDDFPDSWPWDRKWWKPSGDPIRNLIKAGALIAAEIDRLQRLKEQNHE